MLRVALLHFCLEDYTIELANGLANFVELTLIHPEKLSSYCQSLLDSRIHVRSFFKYRVRNLKNFISMRDMVSVIRELDPDILHVQETKDPWYDLALLFNQMPPLIMTVHDATPHLGDRELATGMQYSRKISLSRSNRLIVHARSQQEELIQRFQIPRQKISILPHGELGSLYLRKSSQKNVIREPNTLLFYGRIWPYKGLKYLIEAMSLVAEEIPDLKLVIAGKGENLKTYFPKDYDPTLYEVHNRFIPYEEVAELFQRCAAVILPYIEASQSGVASIAYGMGTPVIASDIGGLSEIIRHNQDGLLVPPKDTDALAKAIIRLLKDQALYKQIQLSQEIRCQNDLNWSKIAYQTVDIYHQMIG